MGGSKGGGGGGTQTTVSSSQPWQGVMPYLSQLYKGATAAQKATPNAPWGGPLTASPRPESIAAQDYTMELANSFQNAGAGTMQLAGDTIAGKYLDPNSNPYFSGAVNAALRPVEDQFYNVTLPGISDKAIAQGAYGGDREGITSALASSEFTKNLADTSANMAWSNYANERDLQMKAPYLMQLGEQLQLAPAQLYGGVGDARQATEQSFLDQALGLYQQQQTAPWTGMDEWSKILQGGGSGSSGTTSQTQSSTGGTPSWLQGALGGAGIGATIGNIAGATGLAGYAPFVGGGSILGALLGLI